MANKILPILICIAFILQSCSSTESPEDQPTTEATTSPIGAIETPVAPLVSQTSDLGFEPILLKVGFGYRSSKLDLYFTDPFGSYAATEVGGVDGVLSAAIVSASKSVDLAINSLSLPLLTRALIRAKDRGIPVRVILESDYLIAERPNPQALLEAGIPIVVDDEEGIMNNNFVVIDNNKVWTGSMSFTARGVYHGYDYLINIRSEEVAQNYTKEFDEMYSNYQFGPNVVPETPNPTVTVDGIQVETMFLPDDLFAARLTELLNSAEESIVLMMSTFTSAEFGELIRTRAAAGVQVTGVIDHFQPDPNQPSEFDLFRKAGLDIRLGNPEVVLFSNAIIIDNQIVVTGTYNFSRDAELLIDGNVLIIHSQEVAKKFMEEFKRVQATAQP